MVTNLPMRKVKYPIKGTMYIGLMGYYDNILLYHSRHTLQLRLCLLNAHVIEFDLHYAQTVYILILFFDLNF